MKKQSSIINFKYYKLLKDIFLEDGNTIKKESVLKSVIDNKNSKIHIHVEFTDGVGNIKRIFWVRKKDVSFLYSKKEKVSIEDFTELKHEIDETWLSSNNIQKIVNKF